MERKKPNALAIERAKYELTYNASGKLKAKRLSVEKGLFLFITPNNVKSWRYEYRLNGRRVIVYGQYPQVSLKQAEDLHTDARRIIATGQIPVITNGKVLPKREAASLGVDNRFRAVARDWYRAELRANKNLSEAWRENTKRWLRQANTDFGNKLLPDIEAADILAVIKKVEAKGFAASAEYLRQTVSRVFHYGILQLRAPRGFNPAQALQGAIKVPKKRHHPKLERDQIKPFIDAVQQSDEPEEIKLGLMILLHTFPRRQELVFTPWSEIDEDTWTINAARMKKDRAHLIPLSTQVQDMFTRLKELAKDSPYVFPSPNDPRKPRTRQTFNLALYRLGYKGVFSPHGVRSTAASILADQGWSKDVVDAALAHSDDDDTRAAYFRNSYVEQRRTLAQEWSDLLDGLVNGAKVIPIGEARISVRYHC
jgi:integrase